MCVIIEGPDGSGKSTLIEKLAELSGYPTRHKGGPPKSNEEAMQRMEDLYNEDYGKICDRCVVISEPIYGHILRRHSHVTPRNFKEGIERLRQQNWAFVFCIAEHDPDTGHKDWKPSDHMSAIEANLPAIRLMYRNTLNEMLLMGATVYIYDWQQGGTPEEVYMFLKNWAYFK
jgi:hypothetical protein